VVEEGATRILKKKNTRSKKKFGRWAGALASSRPPWLRPWWVLAFGWFWVFFILGLTDFSYVMFWKILVFSVVIKGLFYVQKIVNECWNCVWWWWIIFWVVFDQVCAMLLGVDCSCYIEVFVFELNSVLMGFSCVDFLIEAICWFCVCYGWDMF